MIQNNLAYASRRRSKMGRPRVRPTKSARISKRSRSKRQSAALSSNRERSEQTRPARSETSSPSSDIQDSGRSGWDWQDLLFEHQERSLMNPHSPTSTLYRRQSHDSGCFLIDDICHYNLDTASSEFDFSGIVDYAYPGDLNPVDCSSLPTPESVFALTYDEHSQITSSFEQAECQGTDSQFSTLAQLPDVLSQLQGMREALKATSRLEPHKDEIRTIVSTFCEVIRNSESRWMVDPQPPLLDLITLQATISMSVELYAILVDELCAVCPGWSDHQEPGTHDLTQLQANAFAMNLHVLELKQALDMVRTTVFDEHTAQAVDTAYATVMCLLGELQACLL